MNEFVQRQINEYLKRAHRALRTGRLVLDDQDYIAAVNRAYYAIFYALVLRQGLRAASALLATKGLERSKHSGVIAAFRQHFVKTGLIEVKYSDVYGTAMSDRHDGDYSLDYLSHETAARDLDWAERFLSRVEKLLTEIGVLT